MGKKKKKNKELLPDCIIDVDVYQLQVALFFSRETADAYFHQVWGQAAVQYQEDMTEHTHAMAFLFETDTGGMIHGLVLPGMPSPEVLAHECLHLIDMISQTIGMPCNMDTTEPRAYLMQFLYASILDACMTWLKENPEWQI